MVQTSDINVAMKIITSEEGPLIPFSNLCDTYTTVSSFATEILNYFLNHIKRRMNFQRPCNLSKSEALQIASACFKKEWPRLRESDISVSRMQLGLNNEIYGVSRATAVDDVEPSKLVIRKFGTVSQNLNPEVTINQRAGMWLSEENEKIVFAELGRHGLGPKLYGQIPGYRVEEFIDCHNVTYEESLDPEIEADIAKNLAHIHSLQLPLLPKPAYKFVDVMRAILVNVRRHKQFFETIHNDEVKQVFNHDFEGELQFMEYLLEEKHNRIVFIHWDPHFGNIAVLNNHVNEKKTMIFDCEIACYNTRGKDFGTFLLSRSGFYPVLRPDRRIESMSEFATFLQAYLNEAEALFPDFDSNGKDSLDHVMMETLIGGMTGCLCYMLRFMYLAAEMKGEGGVADSLLTFVPALFQGFKECKYAFSCGLKID